VNNDRETVLSLAEGPGRYLFRYMQDLARKVAARYDLGFQCVTDVDSLTTWEVCDPDGQPLGALSSRYPFKLRITLQKNDFHLVVRLMRNNGFELMWEQFSGEDVLTEVLPEVEAATGLIPRSLSIIEELVESEMS